jgi:uncharacterized protein YidB (DUF937 family)
MNDPVSVVINDLVEKHGGVQGIVNHLLQQGLGKAAQSWVRTGPNLPICADQIVQACGISRPLEII